MKERNKHLECTNERKTKIIQDMERKFEEINH